MRYLGLFFSFLFLHSHCMQMHVHNVGQGNGVFLKNGKNALIVDFGAHQSGKYCHSQKKPTFGTGGYCQPIASFLKDTESITVVITHAHADHHSLFQYLPENIYSKINTIYASTYGDGTHMLLPDGADFEKNETGGIITINGKKISWIMVDCNHHLEGIEPVLGDDIAIHPILPTTWPTTGKTVPKRSEDANDNSISLVVECGSSKVLLSGDSTGATLNAVQKDYENIDFLKNITCIILPHHGSNLNGAFSWFYFVKSNITDAFSFPLLTIISSDPKECDRLPWAGVSKFTCDRPGGNSKVPFHIISTEQSLEYNIDEPIYLTANTESGFFRIIFDPNGEHAIYDGDPVSYAPDLLKVPVQNKYVSPQDLLKQWGNFDTEEKKRKIEFILESIGEFSTELPKYIEWITSQLANLADNKLLISAIRNLNSFMKEDLLQQQFSTPLLSYLKNKLGVVSEDLIMACLVNYQSLFLGDLLNEFSAFLHNYLSQRAVSIKLVTECLKHHATLFPNTSNDLVVLLLNNLDNTSSYEDWEECMTVAMRLKNIAFLRALLEKMPEE